MCFLNIDEADKLCQFLKNINYKDENGHGTKNYGKKYIYNGAADDTDDEIPAELMVIIEKIKKKFPDVKINECLVNRYLNGDAKINEHSDDELHIDPESTIFCLSVGQERNLIFKDKLSGDQIEHCAKNGSLYTMTRTSQAYYSHRIDAENCGDSVRFSLTFRHLNKQFNRSTILIGDSNTSDFKFGEGTGTFGASLPGKRVKAATVEDINPFDCVAYKNVVFVVGTNNLRSKYISHRDDIANVLKTLQEKIRIIQKIRKDIKIIILPVLPTRSADMNRHIVYFNRILYTYVSSCPSSNISLPGLYEFLDDQHLLSRNFTRDGDYIHLNPLGISRLALIIKGVIFNRLSNNGVWKSSPRVQYHHSRPP